MYIIRILFFAFCSIAITEAKEPSTKNFSSPYGVSLQLPSNWKWDSSELRAKKVKLAQLIGAINQDGKVRILNTGTPPGSSEGYARVRLSITSDAQLSQEETRDLSDQDMEVMKQELKTQLSKITFFRVDPSTVAVTKTRADTDYWAYRMSYTRSGMNGDVRVELYYVPFSNRAVLLTLSYQIAKKQNLAPKLLKVWSSLDLKDEALWPKQKG